MDYGTGSYPCPPQGLHDSIRFIASHPPLIGPYLRIASTEYTEQVGEYRQALPRWGDIAF